MPILFAYSFEMFAYCSVLYFIVPIAAAISHLVMRVFVCFLSIFPIFFDLHYYCTYSVKVWSVDSKIFSVTSVTSVTLLSPCFVCPMFSYLFAIDLYCDYIIWNLQKVFVRPCYSGQTIVFPVLDGQWSGYNYVHANVKSVFRHSVHASWL